MDERIPVVDEKPIAPDPFWEIWQEVRKRRQVIRFRRISANTYRSSVQRQGSIEQKHSPVIVTIAF
jgi:hypothetical protein